jgi:hypothetical protein
MSMVIHTGRKKKGICNFCGALTLMEELKIFGPTKSEKFWRHEEHNAPCGAPCMGGGISSTGNDIHGDSRFPCPRCNFTVFSAREIERVIVHPSGAKRVLIRKYHPVLAHLGFRIDLEILQEQGWKLKSCYGTGTPDSLDGTLRLVEKYFPWIQAVTTQEAPRSDERK